MAGTETLVSGAPHGLAAYQVPYEFAEGFAFELSYPFWSRLKVGEKVELKKVLAHRDVQQELFWKARQLTER